MLLTLALVIGTRLTPVAAGAVAVVGFGLAWMAGIAGGIGDLLGIDALRVAGTTARLLLPTDVPWRGAMYSLRPPDDVLTGAGEISEVFTISPFFSGAPPPPSWLAWCAFWVVGTLAVGAVLLRRREL